MVADLSDTQEQMTKLLLERSSFPKALKSPSSLKAWNRLRLLLPIQLQEFKSLMKEKKKVRKNNNTNKF